MTKNTYHLFVLQICEVFRAIRLSSQDKKILLGYNRRVFVNEFALTDFSFSSIIGRCRFGHTCMTDVHSLLLVLSKNGKV